MGVFLISKGRNMLILQDLTYLHPNQDILFKNIDLSLQQQEKIALVGNNGAGKSTLLRIIAGDLEPSSGSVHASATPYYVPQVFGQYNGFTIAQALGVAQKLNALKEIMAGHFTEANLSLLDEDWTIEERCREAMAEWGLEGFDLDREMSTLSGGQKTKVFLAGIAVNQPEVVLLDEPGNHLDSRGRQLLYDFISKSSTSLILVSHDRKLLNLTDTVYELSKRGLVLYGGNYDFYAGQKKIEKNALEQDLRSKEKELRRAKETERETAERKQKLDARGKKQKLKAGVPTISLNTLRNNAERSGSRLTNAHAEKRGAILQELDELRKELPPVDNMKFGFDDSELHHGKILLRARDINHGYGKNMLWTQPLSLQITSGERIALKGLNGSGKTSLIKIMLGKIEPVQGVVERNVNRAVYLDQDYSLVDNGITVYEQAQRFNDLHLQEHEVKIRLHRFLFTKEYWDKPCSGLSGGEKMRLMLCCISIGNEAPDMIVLDEPTNNLDMQNVNILATVIADYKGTLLVVSHDQHFLELVNVQKEIDLGDGSLSGLRIFNS